MAVPIWTEGDTESAQRLWAEYQGQHDLSEQIAQAAGVDPVSGRIWFATSAKEIVAQMESQGVTRSLYFVRVGADYYLRKRRVW